MRGRLIRVLGLLSASLVASVPAVQASPILLVTIEGFIPELTVRHHVEVLAGQTVLSDDTVTHTFDNVPFTGQIRFDGQKLLLATHDPTVGLFPLNTFADIDPGGGPGLGFETDEWMRAFITLGGPVGATLAFNRDDMNVALADVAALLFPYQGRQTVSYMEGSEALAIPQLGGEVGDIFRTDLINQFSFVRTGALQPGEPVGDVFGRSIDTSLRLGIATSTTQFQGPVVSFFGPGAPSAFLWIDQTPDFCPTSCFDHYTEGGLGSMHHIVENSIFDGGNQVTFDALDYRGLLIYSRVELQADPVPEPATMSLLGLGLLAGAVRRRRRSARRS